MFIKILYAIFGKKIQKKILEGDGPAIDLWIQDSRPGGSHTFGYWSSLEDAYGDSRKAPEIQVKIPIEQNGNYYGNPTTDQFNKYLKLCKRDTGKFNLEAYETFMRRKIALEGTATKSL